MNDFLWIEVTDEDIQKADEWREESLLLGPEGYCNQCPVAQAVRRRGDVLPDTVEVSCGLVDYTDTFGKRQTWEMSKRLEEKVQEWDDGFSFSPGRHRLITPIEEVLV